MGSNDMTDTYLAIYWYMYY